MSRSGPGIPGGAERERLAGAPVARLATIRADGRPHVVPVTFAVDGDTLVTAVDSKPKRTTQLQRLRNLAGHPTVSLLVDAYADDWTQLWWLRVDGLARVVTAEPDRTDAVAALVAKYAQYRTTPPAGPAVVITPTGWTFWSSRS